VGVVFDGNNIWVTNEGGNSVTKLRSLDGAPLGTFPVGPGPTGIAFDGANVWIANTGGNTLSKR
jgi:DNA-binding beta-propeller fold protein YncE